MSLMDWRIIAVTRNGSIGLRPQFGAIYTAFARRMAMFPATIACATLALCAAPVFATDSRPSQAQSPVSSQPGDYKLGPLDKISLRAFEWRASRDEVYEWKALNADYAVGPGGRVFLPLVGEIPAAGLTVGELSQSIAERLQHRLGLAAAPDVSVEVVSFRPFYVTGDVQKPGEYAYRPELSLLQSVTLAGGLVREDEARAISARRTAISTRGELSLLSGDLHSLLARKARLDAEVTSDGQDIRFPPALLARASENWIATLLEQERTLFQTRKDSFSTQLRALQELKSHLETEIGSLVARLDAHETEVSLLKQEFESIRGLHEKGLATSPRKTALERSLAQLRGERIRMETEMSRAKQEVSRTAIMILELKSKRATELTSESLKTREALEQVLRKSDTAERMARDVTLREPMLLQVANGERSQPAVRYTIVRRIGAKTIEIDAAESTTLQPGDAVKVEVIKAGATEDETESQGVKAFGVPPGVGAGTQNLVPASATQTSREPF